MKIVQVTIEAHEGNGGVYTSVKHFSRALDGWSENHTIDFNFLERGDETDSTILISPTFAGRKFGWIDRHEQTRLDAKLRGAAFVIIHVPYRFHAGFVADWCVKNRVPYAFVPHGAFDPYVFTYRAWQKKAWLTLVGRRLIANAAFVIYATRGEAAKAARYLPKSRSLVLSWPTALPSKIDRVAAREAVRRQFGIPQANRILLFLGRLNPMKRPAETSDAFRRVAPPNWTLVIAGPEDGVSSGTLKSDDRVKVIGAVFGTEKESLCAASDALVLFSHRENFGFAVTEALSHGLPVLVSEELDLAHEIAGGDFGWVADARTPAGRQSGIVALTSAEPNELSDRGARGRAWVAETLSEDRFASVLRASIEQAVGQTSAGVLC